MEEVSKWSREGLEQNEIREKRDEFMRRNDIMESDPESTKKTIDAVNDSYYGPPRKRIKYEVLEGERNEFPGRLLVGTTGALGYHVPAADQKTNIKMKGRYLTECMQKTTVVRVHKKFRVPRKIEELICVQTGSNAIPGNNGRREEPISWWIRGRTLVCRTFQYDVVAWESRANPKNGEKLWRLGYVMNDMDTTLRVMIPNGRLYILKASRVVKFYYHMDRLNYPLHPRFQGKKKYNFDMDVPDTDFMSAGFINDFTDDDWYYENDVTEILPIFSSKFKKDTGFPFADM